jgi:hypothetical protein
MGFVRLISSILGARRPNRRLDFHEQCSNLSQTGAMIASTAQFRCSQGDEITVTDSMAAKKETRAKYGNITAEENHQNFSG